MKLKVEYYGVLKGVCSDHAEEVEFDDGANVTVATAMSRLVERHPGLDAYREYVACAVDAELCQDDAKVADGAVLALLPPVSGG